MKRVIGRTIDQDRFPEPVGTRGFSEREGPLRHLGDADLWDALTDRMATLNDVAAAADEVPADTDVAWTGRTMKVPWFAEHMREELILHGWDITGDCDISAAFQTALAEPWMTTHSVFAVGRPLLAKGVKQPQSARKPWADCGYCSAVTERAVGLSSCYRCPRLAGSC